MDLAAPVGITLTFVAVVVAYLLDGGNLLTLVKHAAPFVLIPLATIGMTMASFPMKKVLRLPRILATAFFPRREDPQSAVETLVALAEKARKEGLLALQDEVPRLENPLLARGLQMIVDGSDPDVVRESLRAQVELEAAHIEGEAAVLEQAGGYSPTVGIIGTVLSLTVVLGNLGGDATSLGEGIASAFMATFYGVLLANAVWMPLANKVKVYAQERAEIGQMIIAGLVSLQTGAGGRSMRDKLAFYLVEGGKAPARGEEP